MGGGGGRLVSGTCLVVWTSVFEIAEITEYFIHPILGNYSVNSHMKKKKKKKKRKKLVAKEILAWTYPCHTQSTAFQHFPPNSARFSYATERALFISALRKVRVLIWLQKQPSAKART